MPDGKFGWTSRAVVWYDLAVRTGAFARSLAGENFFPSGRECRGSPAACGSAAGQNPLSLFPRKKRKRLLMVSREKGLAAAFRTSSGTLAAPVTGVLARQWLMAWTTQPHMALPIAGGAPGCPLLLFCCRTLVVAGAWHPPTATPAAARLAHSEAECAGVEGQTLRSSPPR